MRCLSRDGRGVSLTQHGEALYSRARKMLKINAEIMDLFSDQEMAGAIRFGVPDDYAVRLLPVILSQFPEDAPQDHHRRAMRGLRRTARRA